MSVPLVQGDAMLMKSKPKHRTSNAERPTSNELRQAGIGTMPELAGGTPTPHIRHPQGLTWLKIFPTVSVLNLETV